MLEGITWQYRTANMHDRRYTGEIERLRSPQRLERLEVERVVGLCLEGLSAHSLLDVGTGSGLFSEKFAEKGLKPAGVDANFGMIQAARDYLPHIPLSQAIAEELPY